MNGQIGWGFGEGMDGFVETQLQENPTDPRIWLMFAHSSLVRGELLKTKDAIEKVIALDSQREFNKVALGGLYYSLAIKAGQDNDWTLLLDAAKRSDELGFTPSMTPRQEADLLFQKARAFVIKQQYSDAIGALETATQLNPLDTNAFTLLGHAHYQAGDWDAARETYVKALRLGAIDPLIAQFLETIEYYIPSELEKNLPQKLDPYMRAAISYVEDRWLGLSLEQHSIGDRKQFNNILLRQVNAQSGEIRWGGRDSVLLRVPVLKLSPVLQELIENRQQSNASPSYQRYNAAIHKVIGYFQEIGAGIQEKSCTLNASTVHKMKAGKSLLAVIFRPIKAPHFMVNLHFVFEKSFRGSVRKKDAVIDDKSLNWRNSFEFILKNVRHKIPFENTKSFFAGEGRENNRFSSLAKIREHFLTNNRVYFIHEMSPGRISSTEISLGSDCLDLIRKDGRLRGIRLVLGADTGIKGRSRFYCIFFASFDQEKARKFFIDLTPQVKSVKGGDLKAEGMG